MEQKSAIILNNEELDLLTNPWFPLLKKQALGKVREQMRLMGDAMMLRYPGHSYKISAGENYRDMPYLVLDAPKISGPEFPFLFRTLFWWGRGVSYQIIIRRDCWIEPATTLLPDGIFLLTGDDLWENDWMGMDYVQWDGVAPGTGEYVKLVCPAETKKTGMLFEEHPGLYLAFEALFSAAQ